MCSGSEAGSYSRRIDIVSLSSRLESNIEEEEGFHSLNPKSHRVIGEKPPTAANPTWNK
jgi:hypothetical protein